eukprot:281489-Karenia_brevis.AAC.1
MLKAVANNQPLSSMKCHQWPCTDNNPTIGIELNYQTQPEIDTKVADLVWTHGQVLTNCHPIAPPWQPSKHHDKASSQMTLAEIFCLDNLHNHNINTRPT